MFVPVAVVVIVVLEVQLVEQNKMMLVQVVAEVVHCSVPSQQKSDPPSYSKQVVRLRRNN